jgi:hypothetical protein
LAAVTKTYAEAACEVGQRLGLPVVNLWKAFMSEAGFSVEQCKEGDELPGALSAPQNQCLVDLMYDGKSNNEPLNENAHHLTQNRPSLQRKRIPCTV